MAAAPGRNFSRCRPATSIRAAAAGSEPDANSEHERGGCKATMNAIVVVALKRPYTFVVLAILILLFGGMAVFKTPTDIFPPIKIPVVAAVWNYNGLLPADMSGRVLSYYG